MFHQWPSDLARQSRSNHLARAALCVAFLAAYILLRAMLGALINPAYNGPDESGHVEYVRSLAERGGIEGTGVESRQPPTYYLIASLIWRATDGQPVTVQIVATRLFSAVAGMVTLVLAWFTARLVWPGRPALALAAAAVILAPGHLYLLSSVNNEPLAVLFSSTAVVATMRLWRISDAKIRGSLYADHGDWRWWLIWIAASTASVGTKLSAIPVMVATFVILILSLRHRLFAVWHRHTMLFGVVAAIVVGVPLFGGYAVLLRQHPSSSYLAALAHVGPQAILHGPLAYVGQGGLTESFRTFWYAYDYSVRWPIAADVVLGTAAAALMLLALGGLIVAPKSHSRESDPPWRGVFWILVAIAAVQVAAVVGRFGFSALLGNPMGGAAQAKAFFVAIVPLAVTVVAGITSAGERLGWRDRYIAAGTLSFVLTMDVASLAVTLWQHYRWLQVDV